MSMVSEEEAGAKECCGPEPCGRWTPTGEPPVEKGLPPPMFRACFGSACMGWRWAGGSLLPTKDGGKGYCGLAGRPT